METMLNQILNKDEKVLWFGRPVHNELSKAPDRTRQYINWGILALALGISVLGFLPYALSSGRSWDVILVTLLMINFIPVIMALRPMLDLRVLDRQTIYAITDRRIIAIVKNSIMELPRSRDMSLSVDRRDGVHGDLCFNGAVGKPTRDSRANAVLGCRDERGLNGLIFYHVADPDYIASLVLPDPHSFAA